MPTLHLSGFPRIGAKCELSTLLEAYWKGENDAPTLLQGARALRQRHWLLQKGAGVQLSPVGDFSLFDHVLDTLVLLGAIPARFGFCASTLSCEQYFAMARGQQAQPALAMRQWFDTHYHYLQPEWQTDSRFSANPAPLLTQLAEARALGIQTKPVLIGPLTLLWLGSAARHFDRLQLLPALLDAYAQLLQALQQQGVQWLQLDEPILTQELPEAWLTALEQAYRQLAASPLKLLLASYFGSVEKHASRLKALPVAGLHLDLASAPEQLPAFATDWPQDKVLSAGIVDGRNIWRSDLSRQLDGLQDLAAQLGERLWLAPSCSLLHSPFDLAAETDMENDTRSAMAFAVQKLYELKLLKRALEQGRDSIRNELQASDHVSARRQSATPLALVKRDENHGASAEKHASLAAAAALPLLEEQLGGAAIAEQAATQLDGFVATRLGAVQLHGSTSITPPIVAAEIHGSAALQQQSIADVPALANTILQWSFVRTDLPRSTIQHQLADALVQGGQHGKCGENAA